MPYRYLEDIALADAAFEAWGRTMEELFIAASDATLNVMVRDIESVRAQQSRQIRISESSIDMLLFQLLQELVYYKDAEQLLLRTRRIRIEQQENGEWTGEADLEGETIDPRRHDFIVDVKAITLHRFEVRQTAGAWTAVVVVDV
jgi:SHS2 domain-containing protein